MTLDNGFWYDSSKPITNISVFTECPFGEMGCRIVDTRSSFGLLAGSMNASVSVECVNGSYGVLCGLCLEGFSKGPEHCLPCATEDGSERLSVFLVTSVFFSMLYISVVYCGTRAFCAVRAEENEKNKVREELAKAEQVLAEHENTKLLSKERTKSSTAKMKVRADQIGMIHVLRQTSHHQTMHQNEQSAFQDAGQFVISEEVEVVVDDTIENDGVAQATVDEATENLAEIEDKICGPVLRHLRTIVVSLQERVSHKMKILMTQLQLINVLTIGFRIDMTGFEILTTIMQCLSGGVEWIYDLFPFLEPVGCADASNDLFISQFHYAVLPIVVGSAVFMLLSLPAGCCRSEWNAKCFQVWGLVQLVTFTHTCSWVFAGLEPAVLIDDKDVWVLRKDTSVRCADSWSLVSSDPSFAACDEIRQTCMLFFVFYLFALPLFILFTVWRVKDVLYAYPEAADIEIHGKFLASDDDGDGHRELKRTRSGIMLRVQRKKSCVVEIVDGPYTLHEIAEDEECGTVYKFSGGLVMIDIPDDKHVSSNAITSFGWMASSYDDGAWYVNYNLLPPPRSLSLITVSYTTAFSSFNSYVSPILR
jgi:hypothetical protein